MKKKWFRKLRDDRGSALLVSLMVIVGLSMLGLGFVAISETETSIAANHANSLQTEAIAETGARTVVEMFQNPDWAIAQGFLPANDVKTTPTLGQIKVVRTFTITEGTSTTTYSSVYKPATDAKLLDKPYRPKNDDRFFGDEDTADLLFNRTTAQANIDALNSALFGTKPEDRINGEITEIKIFAPPIVGGTLTADPGDATGKRKFWVGGRRYGVATVKVTAQKYSDPKNRTGLISQHVVRLTVGEFPLPIPAGPIQGNADVSFGGSFAVHWGIESSRDTLDPSNSTGSTDVSSVPWANAYEHLHFEHGYENVGASGVAQVYPTITGSPFDDQNYFQEVLGKGFNDPWFGARAAGDNKVDGSGEPYGTNPMCFGYSYTSDETATSNAPRNFQWQDVNSFPMQKKVVFPTIKYAFWKKVAQQGKGSPGVFYFKYDGSGFKKNGSGTSHPMSYWVNTLNGAKLGPGFYFFDTNDATDPQALTGASHDAKLTPAESWNSSDANGNLLMVGFIYMNALKWGTTGFKNSQGTVAANWPGELFRDIGYQQWDTSTGDWKKCTGGVLCSRVGGGDGVFSYQDLNGNGRFDAVVMAAPNYNSNDPGAVAHAGEYRIKTWAASAKANGIYTTDCTVPSASYDGTSPAASDCSEPHEPYLNLIYPTDAMSSNKLVALKVGWEAPGSQTMRPKKSLSGTCPDTTTPLNCTSNGYDVDGAMVSLDVVLQGILYNEGGFSTQGNAGAAYGSILIQGKVDATGTADVWFDESLIKGTWSPPGMPRVLISSMQTDETQ